MRRTAAMLASVLFLCFLPSTVASAAQSGGDLTPRVPSSHSVVYREQAVIAADSARIWGLLIDLPGYRFWNPWVVRAEGDAVPGATVEVDVVLGNHVMPATHTVLVVQPTTRFCWRDSGWNAWFVYGQRCRTLERQGDGTVVFTNELILDGILSPIADLAIGRAMRDGMAAETAALKRYAEQAP